MKRWAGIVAVIVLGVALIALALSAAGVIVQDSSAPGPGEGAGAAPAAPGSLTGGALTAGSTLRLAPQTVSAGPGTLRVQVTMPDGYKLNGQAPFTAIWPDNPVAQVPAESRDIRIILPELPLEVPVTFAVGQTDLALDLTVYWCEAVNETLCFVDRTTLVVPLTVLPDGDVHAVTFERALVPPVVQDTPG